MTDWRSLLPKLTGLVSGEVPEHPVVSKKSGHVYERRLIEKYIADHGKDPVTGDSLSVEDLLEVQGSSLIHTHLVDHVALFLTCVQKDPAW